MSDNPEEPEALDLLQTLQMESWLGGAASVLRELSKTLGEESPAGTALRIEDLCTLLNQKAEDLEAEQSKYVAQLKPEESPEQ